MMLEELKEVVVELDFGDPAAVKEVIAQYKDCIGIFAGTNQEGEDTELSFYPDETAILKTYQKNGWTRVDYYDSDGCCEGETFEGRWS